MGAGARVTKALKQIFKRSRKRHQGKRRYRGREFGGPLELNELHFPLVELPGLKVETMKASRRRKEEIEFVKVTNILLEESAVEQ